MEQQTIRQRRFGSLSARRKQKNEEVTPVYETMNKATKRPALSSMDTDASSPSSSPDVDASTSVETLSDISITTPGGMPVMVSDLRIDKGASDIFFEAPALHLTMPGVPKQHASPSPRPVLAPSLNKPSDFSFDRYSQVIDPADLDDIEVFEISQAACSPIEVATPITYIRPNRPSMVSIFNILEKDSNKDAKKSLPPKPDLPSRSSERSIVDKRLSTLSSRSGFVAGEATPFEVPDLPDNAFTMISNASQTDLSNTTGHQEPVIRKQKSSMALLSKALKYGHSRMTSRAQSISPSSSLSRPQSQHGVLSSTSGPAPTSRLPPTPSSRSQPPQPRHVSSKSISSRPATARQATIPPQPPIGVTALPPCNDTISQRSSPIIGNPSPLMGHTSRKKSVSALRTRSDSITHALKSMAGSSSAGRAMGRKPARDPLESPSLPPVPVLITPPKTSVDLNTFPVPPPSRPHSNAGSVVSFSRPLRNSSMPLQGLGVTVS